MHSSDHLIWRLFEIESAKHGHWQIGPFRLWAVREQWEWSLSFSGGTDALDETIVIEVPSKTPAEGELTARRFGFREPPSSIRLTPALAARPIVVTPEEPFLIPPREETTLYVSTPIWVQASVGQGSAMLLDEASYRPSDTWFGSSTREGELCFATKTKARLNFADLPVRPHRAVSVVHLRNRAATVLEVEKVKLPAPNLSLYIADEGHLWTEAVTLDRQQDGELASIELGTGAPDLAVDAEPVSGPREKIEKNFLDRTFGGLIRDLRS